MPLAILLVLGVGVIIGLVNGTIVTKIKVNSVIATLGGEFHIPGTFIGVLIIGIGFNGLAIFGAPTFYQYVFQGAILVIAVGLSSVARQLAKN